MSLTIALISAAVVIDAVHYAASKFLLGGDCRYGDEGFAKLRASA
ncbi:MAG: hypothetical protein AABW54_00165 [Candidatus Micrarchaeota archaeon]